MKLIAISFPAIVLLLASCASQDKNFTLRSRYDASVNFATIKTYSWAPVANPGPYASDVRNALSKQMAARGLVLAPAGHADTTLAYYLIARTPDGAIPLPQNPSYNLPDGTPASLEPARNFIAARTAAAHEGLLIVDLIDPAGKRTLWRALALTEVDRALPASEQRKRISEAAKQLFTHYPDNR